MHRYFIIFKPYMVLSQFSAEREGQQTLKDVFDVPRDVYPVGRLDSDSEGLLILTNDAALNNRLLNPSFQHAREYWVQVEGAITPEALQQLQEGVTITIQGKKYRTLTCTAKVFGSAPPVPERDPPVRFRKHIPTSWIAMQLVEGKNRQVRKMTAAVGFPTLRLIRARIEGVTLEGLQPGEMREVSRDWLYRKLFD